MNFILTTDCCCWIPNVAVLFRDSHKCERQPHLPVRDKDEEADSPISQCAANTEAGRITSIVSCRWASLEACR